MSKRLGISSNLKSIPSLALGTGEISMFDMAENNFVEKEDLPEIDEYNKKDLLMFEKEILGIYVSGHPLESCAKILKKYITTNTLEIYNEENLFRDGQKIIIGGIITEKQIKFTKSNKTMAFLKFEDLYGETEIILFPNVYEKYSEKLFYDSPIIIYGFLKLHESEMPKIICDKIELLSEKK